MQHAANDTDRLVTEDHHAACDGCELLDRRRFLTQAAATVIGAMVGLGMSAERGSGAPVELHDGGSVA